MGLLYRPSCNFFVNLDMLLHERILLSLLHSTALPSCTFPPRTLPPTVPLCPHTALSHPQGKRCFVSGAGNVAQYCAELLIAEGATVRPPSLAQKFSLAWPGPA